jgi:8-oxo-dGTP pyrophosphatase MutT (NUDIX family)
MRVDTRCEVSAGGVVFRQEGGWIKVLISRQAGSGRWVLPKGHVEPGETLEAAAVREVEEETGVRASIIAPLGAPDTYTFVSQGVEIQKSVYYFLMRFESEVPRESSSRLDEVAWLPLDSALDMLDYPSGKEMLQRTKDMLAKL